MLKGILETATFKQSQITVLGTIVNGGLGAIFYILLARYLGPSDFGLLVISITTLTLIADIVDFGTNTGLIRFVSANLSVNKDNAYRFLKLSLEIKLVVWLLVLLLGLFLSGQIAEKIFNKVELTKPLQLVMIGVGGALFFSFATSTLQSLQKFLTWSILNILTNALRLGLILILLFSGKLSLLSGLAVYVLLPFMGFFTTLFILPSKSILKVKGEHSLANKLFSYNRWVAIFTIISAFSARLDTFLTAKLLTTQEVGIYGAANQLASIVPQIVGALGVVASPKFASFQNINRMLIFFKKFQMLVLGLSILGLLTLPFAYFAIPFIYGDKYLATILPFIIYIYQH